MKTKSILLATLALLFMSACKNGEKSDDATKTDVAKTPVKEYFNVEMTVTAEKQDDFTVYYTEDGTNNFVGGQAVWKGVKGGSVEEVVVLDLPEEVIPTNIRLDFGINKDRKNVEVKNIKMNFHDKSFEIKGSDFFNFFTKNDQMMPATINAQAGTVTFTRNPENKEGTYYYPRQELLDQIAKMTK